MGAAGSRDTARFPGAARAMAPSQGARILLVGDASRSCIVSRALAPGGYRMDRAASLPEARAALEAEAADALIIEAQIDPEGVILECERLARSRRGVVVLHCPADHEFAIRALEAGADDCLPTDHNPRELLARVRAVLRRHRLSGSARMQRHVIFDQFTVDRILQEVRDRTGALVPISPKQFRLLAGLLERPGEVISREVLFDLVQGEDSDCFDRALDVQVSRLRRQLAAVSGLDLISAYRGFGYRLNAQVARA
jgi:two-component system OmpR family response regulator